MQEQCFRAPFTTKCKKMKRISFRQLGLGVSVHHLQVQNILNSTHRTRQEYIPVGCVLPARNLMAVGGGGAVLRDREPPGQRPPMKRITDRCKNITLPQLVAGGKNIILNNNNNNKTFYSFFCTRVTGFS